MPFEISSKDRFDHLLRVISSQRFLNKEGLGNEVPFFICPFNPRDAFKVNDEVALLIKQLSVSGKSVLHIDLYDLSLDILSSNGTLDEVLEIEAEHSKDEIKELFQGVLDTRDFLIPNIAKKIVNSAHDIIFLTGIGEVYPYIRSHHVLENLQSTAKDRPTVMFFPGSYTHALATGASLNLFGTLENDRYYRAFNIMNYEV